MWKPPLQSGARAATPPPLLPLISDLMHVKEPVEFPYFLRYAILELRSEAVPILVEKLKDKNEHIRRNAANLLGSFGPRRVVRLNR